MTPLEHHEASTIFPIMEEGQYQELKKDIQKNGLLNPIVMYQGKVLDGRHRYRACLELKVDLKFTTFTNTTIEAPEFVMSQNMARRHMTKSQCAAAAVKYKELISASVKAKRYATMAESRRNGSGEQPRDFTRSAADIAGRAFGVRREAVVKAQKVMREDPETFKLMQQGKITINDAYIKVNPAYKKALDKNEESYLKNRLATLQSRSPSAQSKKAEERARKLMIEESLKGFKIPSNIYATNEEIFTFDNLMETKGYSLSLTRIKGTWTAVYTKFSDQPGLGFTTHKAAILSAGKEALAQEVKV